MKKRCFILPILFTLCFAANAQEVKRLRDGQPPGKGNLSQVAWLEGFWSGPGLGGDCEEVWLPARDGQMMGTFRFFDQGKLIFSELFFLSEENESMTLKLKHFSADLKAWEDKDEWVEFRLIEIEDQTIWLDGLTMKREGDNLTVWVELESGDQSSVAAFEYTRMDF
ncbi:MAG: hypothetical protein HLUCCX10_14630 [Algoriphagus marincola HL-49]|uniref:DUF6265 domain-containing protein n=1 Tax=Algoriphagus marincola HL-49 TaxID=1305737 RepID=A0A0N8KF13_9BACT|nr:MAG: hypothetical protein HLUCCX10_14630 [Algoriphagus marincola HL-49]